jgi:heptosyltransferase-2
MAMPAVNKLKALLPASCALAVVCKKGLAPLWEAAPWVNQVISFSGSRVAGEAASVLRWSGMGAGIVFPNSWGSAFDLWNKRIPVRIGRAGRGRGLLLTDRLPVWRPPQGVAPLHQLRHYLELVEMLGEVPWDAAPAPLEVPDWPEVVASLEMPFSQEWLVLAPSAAYGPAKQWPARYFRQIARNWSELGGSVAAVGTAQDHSCCEGVLDSIPRGLNLAGRTNLRQLMAVLLNSRCIVANDSGVMHLGAALGCSGVALFGSTNELATGPLGGHWVTLKAAQPCSPCFKRRCAHAPTGECKGLLELTPERVWQAVQFSGTGSSLKGNC